jgi:hypothetical protein
MPGIELGLYNNLGFLNIFLFYGLCNDQIIDNSVGVATIHSYLAPRLKKE